MAQYRVDYVTKEGKRGMWDGDFEHPALADVQRSLPETLKYAKSRMPEIRRLVVVEITERDLVENDGIGMLPDGSLNEVK